MFVHPITCLWSFDPAASAPSRTLGRRKLVRNRFTIDTDIVFDGEPEPDLASPEEPVSARLQQEDKPEQQQAEVAGDTDRWVEEQFDLEEYEDQEEVKETDILSDDDDFCQTPGTPSAEADLEAPVMALSLEGGEEEECKGLKSPTGSETQDPELVDAEKQNAASEDEEDEEDVKQTKSGEIWVRRDPSTSSPDCDM